MARLHLLPPWRKTATASVTVEQLYGRHAGVVRARCRFLLQNPADADDALQEVFVRVHEKLHTLTDPQAALGWLLTIATRHCLNVRRSQAAKWTEEVRRQGAQSQEGADGPGDGVMLVRRVLDAFDPETQAIAVHYYVDEMSLDEVSTAVGRSVPTVRKRLAAFAAAARAIVEHDGGPA